MRLPWPFRGDVGYSDAQIGEDLFEVTYNGSRSTGGSDATYYATVRAAELALAHRKPYFRIERVEQSAITETDVLPPEYRTQRIQSRDRSFDTTYTTSTPGRISTYDIPISRLVVRLQDTADQGGLEARKTLQEAAGRGIELSPATMSALGMPSKSKPPAGAGG